jgi:hypothetical protein
LFHDDWRDRAFLQFASEEAKHIQLFRNFRARFEEDFGYKADVIGPGSEIAKFMLSQDPLGFGLAVLQIEWMTQKHYVDGFRDNGVIDPLFKNLLKQHWLEESQHARLDSHMVEAIAEGKTQQQIDAGFDAYFAVLDFVAEGMKQQTAFDLDAFERLGRKLTPEERAKAEVQQLSANRWTYIGSGMTHPEFLATARKLSPKRAAEIVAAAPRYS